MLRPSLPPEVDTTFTQTSWPLSTASLAEFKRAEEMLDTWTRPSAWTAKEHQAAAVAVVTAAVAAVAAVSAAKAHGDCSCGAAKQNNTSFLLNATR
jgi:hypothetical protein